MKTKFGSYADGETFRNPSDNPRDGDCFRGEAKDLKVPKGYLLVYNEDEDETYVIAKSRYVNRPHRVILKEG